MHSIYLGCQSRVDSSTVPGLVNFFFPFAPVLPLYVQYLSHGLDCCRLKRGQDNFSSVAAVGRHGHCLLFLFWFTDNGFWPDQLTPSVESKKKITNILLFIPFISKLIPSAVLCTVLSTCIAEAKLNSIPNHPYWSKFLL